MTVSNTNFLILELQVIHYCNSKYFKLIEIERNVISRTSPFITLSVMEELFERHRGSGLTKVLHYTIFSFLQINTEFRHKPHTLCMYYDPSIVKGSSKM